MNRRVLPVLAALALAAVPRAGADRIPAAATTQPDTARSVIPFPGTPDASPRTQVIFSAVSRADIASVSVTGSHTGAHAGRLLTLPDSAGTAFVPTRRFGTGERVRVRALLRSGARVAFSFTTARPGQPPAAVADASARQASLRGGPPTRHFRSAPGLHPSPVTVTVDRAAGSGDIFLDPGQKDVEILDGRGHVVWYHPVTAENATNMGVQRYRGQSVLTWWQGRLYQHAVDVVFNRHYHRVAAVRAGNGYVADGHEFQITPQGTALIDAYVPTGANLTSVGGSATGTILDCVVQEIDIPTGRVLWEWHALGHIPLTQSHVKPSGYYDAYHLNSIQQLPGGNLLISVRNTWAVYEISKHTGQVIWTLGGKASSFRMGRGTNFEWQHDARLHPDGTLSLFDDAFDDEGYPQAETQSSAKVLRVNTRTMSVTLKRRYTHSPPLLASVAGNIQLLPNHNVFVDWGSQNQFSEYAPSGRQIFNALFPLGISAYRAHRFPWVGEPLTRPSLALSRTSHGVVKLYVSWNGATRVAAWRFLAGRRRGRLSGLGAVARRTGFETVVRRRTTARFFAAQALDSHGRVLARSTVHAGPGQS